MEVLQIAEEKGLADVFAFRLNEYDAVAAYSLDEAIAWYKETTGLSDEDLYSYDDIEAVSPDYKVHNVEDFKEMISVQELINTYWNGVPFIVFSTEF